MRRFTANHQNEIRNRPSSEYKYNSCATTFTKSKRRNKLILKLYFSPELCVVALITVNKTLNFD